MHGFVVVVVAGIDFAAVNIIPLIVLIFVVFVIVDADSYTVDYTVLWFMMLK